MHITPPELALHNEVDVLLHQAAHIIETEGHWRAGDGTYSPTGERLPRTGQCPVTALIRLTYVDNGDGSGDYRVPLYKDCLRHICLQVGLDLADPAREWTEMVGDWADLAPTAEVLETLRQPLRLSAVSLTSQ